MNDEIKRLDDVSLGFFAEKSDDSLNFSFPLMERTAKNDREKRNGKTKTFVNINFQWIDEIIEKQ